MTCEDPRHAILVPDVNGVPHAKFFSREEYLKMTDRSEVVNFPCGKCKSCLMYRSSHWAARCVLEASQHSKKVDKFGSTSYNTFITLTYSPEYIERCPDGSLNFDDLKNFWKRLRKKFPNAEISYYACGEYGSKNKRPHFHALVFNFDFDDKYEYRARKIGSKIYKLYRSPTLEKLWKFGHSIIGDLTFESAAYVARYTLKKQYGRWSSDYYGDLVPENNRVSNKNPIAKSYILSHFDDVYGNVSTWYKLQQSGDGVPSNYFDGLDLVHLPNGSSIRPPRYFDKVLQSIYPEFWEAVKSHRLDFIKSHDTFDTTRLDTYYRSSAIKIKKLLRPFEDGESELFENE